MTPKSPLPSDSAERKEIPLSEGVLGYCPAALVAVAKASQAGNGKHVPGQTLHHDRSKSPDHTDCLLRHLVDYQAIKAAAMRAGGWAASDNANVAEEHLGNMAWRMMMYVQQELESMGRAPLAPNAKPAPVAEQSSQKGSPIAEQWGVFVRCTDGELSRSVWDKRTFASFDEAGAAAADLCIREGKQAWFAGRL